MSVPVAKCLVLILVLLAVASVTLRPISVATAGNGPELPAGCESIQVQAGHKLAFHVFARGVQVYRWNGTSWVFEEPRAGLFAEANFFGEVGTHYRGPNWESKSGSRVKAVRVQDTGCTPDPTAIAWLLLVSTETTGPGIFNKTSYIQRVNTTGGVAPTEFGSSVGELKEVPYTAEYYFYRAD